MKRFLARLLDTALNTAWPMEAQHRAHLAAAHLADLESDRDVFEPDELWAAAHLKQPADAPPLSPEVSPPQQSVGGPKPEEGKKRPRLLQQPGPLREGSSVLESTTGSLTGSGWIWAEANKLKNIAVTNKREMGIIQAQLDTVTVSLTITDWELLFALVNKVSFGNLYNRVRANGMTRA